MSNGEKGVTHRPWREIGGPRAGIDGQATTQRPRPGGRAESARLRGTIPPSVPMRKKCNPRFLQRVDLSPCRSGGEEHAPAEGPHRFPEGVGIPRAGEILAFCTEPPSSSLALPESVPAAPRSARCRVVRGCPRADPARSRGQRGNADSSREIARPL